MKQATIKIAGEPGSEAYEMKVHLPFSLEISGEDFTIRSPGKTTESGEIAKDDKIEIVFN